MHNRSIWKMLLGAILITIVIGCATVPPQEMIEHKDHAGLATWYQQEAGDLRAKAEEMKKMAKSYEERMGKPHQSSALVKHCRNLADRYATAATEAEALAKLHAEQQKK